MAAPTRRRDRRVARPILPRATGGVPRRTSVGPARSPDAEGLVTSSDGVRIAWESYGNGSPTLVLMPSTPIVHSRQWKGQIAYLSRHWRVVVYDGRGNGLSDRPTDPEAYATARIVGDLEAVLGVTGTARAVLVGLCTDALWPALLLAAEQPDRVAAVVGFGIGVPLLTPPHAHRVEHSMTDPLPTDEGWAKQNLHFWRRDYPAFAEFFFTELLPEPHSTKHVEDAVAWAVDGDPEAMIADLLAPTAPEGASAEAVAAVARRARCPMLLVKGTDDRCQPMGRAERLAALTGARLVLVEGAGHMIPARHPVLANLLIRDFVRSLPEAQP